jgi:hypothetical protein
MALELSILAYIEDGVAEAGTTETNIKMTAHGLSVGDMIVNSTLNEIASATSRAVSVVVDVNNITVASITGQASTDTIKKYRFLDKTNLLHVSTLKINLKADQRNDCNFDLITDVTYIPRVGQEVIIKNEGVKVFGGIIKTVKRKKLDGNSKILLSIYSNGYNDIPGRRTLKSTWFNTLAGDIVSAMVTTYLSQEGVTAGTIHDGITFVEFSDYNYSIKEALDKCCDASGYKWYIDNNKALHFLQDETIVDAPFSIGFTKTAESGTTQTTIKITAHGMKVGYKIRNVTRGNVDRFVMTIVDADNFIVEAITNQTGGDEIDVFLDYANLEAEETLENYRNNQFLNGGYADLGNLISLSLNDPTEILARQAIEAGSGVYGNVFEDESLQNSAYKTAESGTTTTNIKITSHNLLDGDMILNDTRSSLRNVTVVDVANVTVDAVPDQTTGDSIVVYDANNCIQNLMKKYSRVPLKITFDTFVNDFRPNTRLRVQLSDWGIADSYYLIEEVNISAEQTRLKSSIVATLRNNETGKFSTQKSAGTQEFFEQLIKGSGGRGSGSGTTIISSLTPPSNTTHFWNNTNTKKMVMDMVNGYISGEEITDPSAPAANYGVLYFRDDGAGKTQLCVRFATGAVQVIATEP